MISSVLIDGELSDGRIPVTDSAVLRGDGCFEVLRVYGGRAFALGPHLDRLQRSADLLDIELPARSRVGSWVERVAAEVGEGAVRIVVTRGAAVPGMPESPRVVVFGHPLERESRPARLLPLRAPWHAAGEDWELKGAKLLSYAANMAATRHARAKGYDDALLHTVEGVVLEGPTFSLAWVVGGVVETPGLELGILDSITRRLLLSSAPRLGIEVVEGTWGIDRLVDADEVMVWSTVREVQPVSALGNLEYPIGPITTELSGLFASLVEEPSHYGTDQG